MGVSAGMSISLMMKHQNKLDETSVLLTVIEQYAKATVSLSDDFTSYLLKKYVRFQAIWQSHSTERSQPSFSLK